MDRKPIRDASGKLLGFVEQDDRGNQTARSAAGKLLGRYDRESDLTRDPAGKLRTRGNSLTSSLFADK